MKKLDKVIGEFMLEKEKTEEYISSDFYRP